MTPEEREETARIAATRLCWPIHEELNRTLRTWWATENPEMVSRILDAMPREETPDDPWLPSIDWNDPGPRSCDRLAEPVLALVRLSVRKFLELSLPDRELLELAQSFPGPPETTHHPETETPPPWL